MSEASGAGDAPRPAWVYVTQVADGDFDAVGPAWQAYHVAVDGWTGEESWQWFSEAPLTWGESCSVARNAAAQEPGARVLALLASDTYALLGVGGTEQWSFSREQYGEWDAAVLPDGEPLPAAVGDLLVEVSYSFEGLPESIAAPDGWDNDLRPPLLRATGDGRSGTVTVQVPDRQTGWEGRWAELAVLHALSTPAGGLLVAPQVSNSLEAEDNDLHAFP